MARGPPFSAFGWSLDRRLPFILGALSDERKDDEATPLVGNIPKALSHGCLRTRGVPIDRVDITGHAMWFRHMHAWRGSGARVDTRLRSDWHRTSRPGVWDRCADWSW